MTVLLRPYRTSDFDNLYALWQAALGSSWPITAGNLRHVIGSPAHDQDTSHFVAEQDGHMVGFAATQTAGKAAGIPLLMVSPEHQRKGIGTKLHTAAMEYLRQKSPEVISLAHGGGAYLWPGVPLDPPGVVEFFKSCGWDFPYTNYDLTQDLTAYQTPSGMPERVARQNIELRPPTSDEITAVLDFEKRVFPFWSEPFVTTAAKGHNADMLVAWDGTSVVGSLLMEMAVGDDPIWPPWSQILGLDMGAVGAVGVDEVYRRRGIGVALVAKASEILQARGVRQCHIGWTDELEFYGKVGYKIWRTYAITED